MSIFCTDPRRKVLTHGQAAVAMDYRNLVFRSCSFTASAGVASEKKVLNVLLPQIEPEQYFDDRLADTLDALFAFGIGDLEMLITRHMIQAL